MVNILGVSAHYHDSAAALIRDGRVIAAAQEEVFTRRKHDSSFPAAAAEWCLRSNDLDHADVDWFAYYELPLLKLRRVRASAAAAGTTAELSGSESWRRVTARGRRDVGALFPQGAPGARVLAVEHHMAHAASAYFPSPFDRAAVVTVDGVGEFTTTSISVGGGNDLRPLRRQSYPHSLGLFYSALTYYCGFRVNSGEYKLMGLAPYGRPRMAELLKEHVIKLGDDGAFRLNLRYFDHLDPLSDSLASPALDELLGRPRRAAESELDEFYCDVAASVQAVFEEAMIKIARYARTVTGERNLCLAGGSALNCVANSKVLADAGFDDVWVQPAASDAGGALGAALYVWHHQLSKPRVAAGTDSMRGAQLGPAFDDQVVARFLDSVGATYRTLPEDALVKTTAELLANGRTVAWFQGRQEFGPRALGNRSILGDPRSASMQQHLNVAVKNRESFRPFAPAVPAEDADRYFVLGRESPYMLFTAQVRPDQVVQVPAQDESATPVERARHVRSTIPAVTHVDLSARVQTVAQGTNPLFWRLLRDFGDLTGVPVLVNTSFNLRGEPIVCSPEDALRTFQRTELDHLCIGSHLLDRSDLAAVELSPHLPMDLD
ncbi:carbamoyltransferase [Kribbella sp. NPDC058245]|uniref:carbamoyltransferase family protein n=1 Tax=Kribbella sp. NPDC058245 TaxID=3346399 RepID=UPI0036E58518